MKEVHDHVGEALERVSRRPNSAVHKAKANGGAHRDPDDHTPTQHSAWKSGSFSAKELQSMAFPPLSWIVPNIIPAEGVTLLCSKPKFGKSWLAYDLCIACTTDGFTLGTIKPAQGNVLYLALEDSKRRLQRRMTKLLPTFGSAWPDKLLLKTEWRRLHEGGLEDIRAWHADTWHADTWHADTWHADTKKPGGKPILVVIDVLAKVRKPVGNRQLYEADYAALADLTKLANELGLAIVVLHHTRKMAADDLMETVSGSYGVSGAVDTIVVMANTPNGAVLDIRGRDVESAELAIEFDKRTCRWRLLGDAAEVHVSSQRAKIIAALKEAGLAMTIPALMEETGMKRNPLEVLLGRMAKESKIQRVGKGLYAHKDYVSPPDDLPPANPPSKNKQSKRGTPRRSVASVRSSKVLTDIETEAPSAQTQETSGQKPSICPSVQSVRENADTNGARSSVPAQTDRTDRQTPAQVTVEARQSGTLGLSGDLSRDNRKTDCRRIAPINQPAAPDDLPELRPFLRRVPVTNGPAPALGPPGDSLDGADGRTQIIEEEEEEASEWTL
jgi:AAA domain-containing protein